MDENDFRISDSGFIEQTRILIVPEKFSAPNLRHSDKNLVYILANVQQRPALLWRQCFARKGAGKGLGAGAIVPKGQEHSARRF
jgi:hypothetical protein